MGYICRFVVEPSDVVAVTRTTPRRIKNENNKVISVRGLTTSATKVLTRLVAKTTLNE